MAMIGILVFWSREASFEGGVRPERGLGCVLARLVMLRLLGMLDMDFGLGWAGYGLHGVELFWVVFKTVNKRGDYGDGVTNMKFLIVCGLSFMLNSYWIFPTERRCAIKTTKKFKFYPNLINTLDRGTGTPVQR